MLDRLHHPALISTGTIHGVWASYLTVGDDRLKGIDVILSGKSRALSSLLVLALAATFFVGLGVVAGPPADAAVGIGDGCTGVPDEAPGFFDYQSSCDRHDQCYVDDPHGEGEAGRLRCDQEFHRSMQDDCSALHSDSAALDRCNDVGDLYYWGVRTFGDIGQRLREDPATAGEVVSSIIGLLDQFSITLDW